MASETDTTLPSLLLDSTSHLTGMIQTQQDQSLRDLFTTAKTKRKDIDPYASATDPVFQENLRSAIECLEKCRELADRISIFSPNETVEDVASTDLQ